VVRIGALFAHFVPDLITTSPAAAASAAGPALAARALASAVGRGAGTPAPGRSGQHGAGQEGGLVTLGQRGERVRAFVRCQVVLGAGDGNGRDDGDAERCAGLQGGAAQARGEPGLVLGDPRERSSAPIAGPARKSAARPDRGQRHDRDGAVQEHHEKRAA